MVIEFDAAKDASNRRKHGVSLAVADGFNWATVLTLPARTEHSELRHRVIGEVDRTVYAAIVTERGARMRIISVRPANRKERRLYAEVRA